MKLLPKILFSLALFAMALSLTACNRGSGRVLEVAYVSAVQSFLRDRVAAVYEKTGTVKNGDRVEVLDHDRRFVKVRTASGETGWIEQRYLVGQNVYDQIQKLTADSKSAPIEAVGTTRNDTKLHVEPGRETEHLYQITSGEKLSILKRGRAEKPGSVAPPSRVAAALESKSKTNGKGEEAKQPVPVVPAPFIEDWWLVRDSHDRVGWVLARMVDIDAPLEIAQYAEGQRIVGFFVLNQVPDGDKKVPQYLTLMTESKDGLPFDFNQIRVFTWNAKHHRYETAYRERFEGMFPVSVGQENFDKEGMLPVFTVHVIGEDGKIGERKYKLNTPIVRRVLAPGEQPVKAAVAKKSKRRR